MYPIHIYEDNTELPQEGEYYLVAGNGIFFRKENAVFAGFFPVSSISFLKDLDTTEAVKCVLPKLPHDMVMKVKKFFVQVFKKHHSEACVVLYYNDEHRQYSIVVPRQWNSHGSVRYIRPSLKLSEDSIGLSVGTIHSHCDFEAFHSGTDKQDESTFDGLHITFGDITKSGGFSVTASLVMNNMRCLVDPLLYLEGVVSSEEYYKIVPPEYEVDYNAWAAEVDSWAAQVNVGKPPFPWTEAGIIAWKEQHGNKEN